MSYTQNLKRVFIKNADRQLMYKEIIIQLPFIIKLILNTSMHFVNKVQNFKC